MSAPSLEHDDDIAIPIKTFHMICERLSNIEQQNERIEKILLSSELNKLGPLNNILLGIPEMIITQSQSKGGEHLQQEGSLMTSSDRQLTLRIRIEFKVHDYEDEKDVLNAAFGEVIRTNVITRLHENGWEQVDPLDVGIEDAELPCVMSEEKRRRVAKGVANKHFTIKLVHVMDDSVMFIVQSKAEECATVIDAMRCAFDAVDVFRSHSDIKSVDICHILGDLEVEAYLDLLKRASQKRHEVMPTRLHAMEEHWLNEEFKGILGGIYFSGVEKFLERSVAHTV